MHTKKRKALIGMKKAKTLLETLIIALEEDTECSEIMTQNLAVIGLLKGANRNLVQAFLESCDGRDIHAKKETLLHLFTLSEK